MMMMKHMKLANGNCFALLAFYHAWIIGHVTVPRPNLLCVSTMFFFHVVCLQLAWIFLIAVGVTLPVIFTGYDLYYYVLHPDIIPQSLT